MGYETLISGLIKSVLSPQFESMKLNVTFLAWTGQDGHGTPTYAAPRTLRALVDLTKQRKYTPSGVLVMTFATLTFLDPIEDTTPTSPWVREQPIDPRDVLTLPDGGTAPIVHTGGFADSQTGRGFVQDTILGSTI